MGPCTSLDSVLSTANRAGRSGRRSTTGSGPTSSARTPARRPAMTSPSTATTSVSPSSKSRRTATSRVRTALQVRDQGGNSSLSKTSLTSSKRSVTRAVRDPSSSPAVNRPSMTIFQVSSNALAEWDSNTSRSTRTASISLDGRDTRSSSPMQVSRLSTFSSRRHTRNVRNDP